VSYESRRLHHRNLRPIKSCKHGRFTIINRIGKTKYRFNPNRAERETLLYSLLPFASDSDFDKAITQNLVDEKTKQLQLRFDYWVSMFEAKYGDILIFYNNLATDSKSEKLILINNMLDELIPETTGNNAN